ncbi:MAG: ABC transporter ATP-binding protein [Methylohalobius crimeensis]
MIAVRLQQLGKSYLEAGHRHWIFRDIDLRIPAGEFVVLLGRSGSGKSTLLNLISGIDIPDRGEIEVWQHPLSRLSERKRTLFRRRHLGFVFQQFNLIPTLTALENVLLPLELNGSAGKSARIESLALLSRLGLEGRGNTFPDRLSGGEQQRVAIARALIHEPEIILADEPTGNLDLETGREVLEILDTLVRERGRTLIMATHSREVVGLADRTLTIGKGRLTTWDS